MIQLYIQGNTDYEKNGDLVLFPSLCEITQILNGSWMLELELPVVGNSHLLVKENCVISAPAPNGTTQLFRIYEVVRNETYIIAYAMPIFMQAAYDCFLTDVRPTNKTGQQALDILMAGIQYSGTSDITSVSTAYYINKTLIEALQSDDDNSFLNRWGGEIYYNNFQITINERIGADNGMKAKFGWNLAGIQQRVNMQNVVTRIVPIAYNGYALPSPGYVDSPKINDYPFVRVRVIKYDDIRLQEDVTGTDMDGYATLAELQQALTERAQAEFEAGIDLPEISYTVNIVDLSKTEQYKDVSDLVKVNLGDTVHCENERLGIETKARCTELIWDCIHERVKELKLGQYEDYFSKVSSVVNSVSQVINQGNNTVKGEAIYGIIDAMQAQLRLQNTVAEKLDVRAFYMEDTDPTSPLYGAMSIGTQGFQIANSRLPDDSDWDWKTFGTAKGFVADYLIGGILASQNYQEGVQGFKMNLNTGEADIPSLEIDTSHLQVQITELQGDVGGLQTSMTEVQGDITDINDDIGNLQADVDGVQNDVDNLQTTTTQKFTQIEADIDGITQTVGEVQTSVTKAQDAADAAQDDVDALTTTVNTQFTQINQTTDSISQTVGSIQQVTDAQSESISQLNTSINNVPELIENALDESGLTELKAQVSSIEQEADQIRIELTEVSQYGDTVEQINRFFDFLQAGLKIGLDESPFYTLLNETELGFYENGNRVAYISNNSLYISSARIQNDLILENPASGDLVRWYVDSAGYVCLQSTSA
nr:MAG TPA: tail protein [Caudoviricetes sp.]